MIKLIRATFFLAIISVVYIAYTNSSGPGFGYTSAPSDGNCTSCHTGTAITSGYRHSKIKLETNWHGGGYLPDSTYTIAITFKDTLKTQAGFQITVLDNSNNPVGVITSVDTRVNAGTKVTGGKTRYYAEHTFTGSSNVKVDSTSWRIKWKAPNTNVGPVKFYVSVLSGNSSGGTTGDAVYTKNFSIAVSTLLPKGKISTTSSLCQNSPIKFSLINVTGSPTSYFWNFGANSSPSTETVASPTVNYSTSGNKTIVVRIRNQYGNWFDTFKPAIKQGPGLPEITENNGTDVLNSCLDDSLTLNIKNIRTGETYKWNPSNAITNSIKIKKAGTYSFTSTLTSTGCVRNSADLVVKELFHDVINIDKINDTILCMAEDTLKMTLKSNSNILSSTITESVTNTILSSGIKEHNVVFTSLSGNLTLLINGKDSNGCNLITKTVKVVVNAPQNAPVFKTTNSTLTSLKFNWTSLPAANGYEVKVGTDPWKLTDNSGKDSFIFIDNLLPSTNVNLSVRGIFNSSVCSKSAIATLTEKTKDCIKPTLSYTMDSAFCEGDTIKLKVTTSDLTNTFIYKNNVKTTGLTYKTAINTANFMENLVIKDSINFCFFDSVKINVLANKYPAKPTITNGPIVDVCQNIGNLIDVNFLANETGSQKYQWYKNGVKEAGFVSGTGAKFRAANTDKIALEAINGRCTTKSTDAEVKFNGEVTCDVKITRIGLTSNYKFVSNPKNYAINTWNLFKVSGDSLIKSNSDSFNFDFLPYKGQSKTIKFTGEKNANCKCAESVNVNLNVLKTKGTLVSGILYPNPTQGILYFNTKLNGQYKIVNISGATVMQGNISAGITTIEVDNIAAGVYQFILNTTNGQEIETVIFK